MSKLFLTGATGYLGQHILHQALEAGYRVCALHRGAPSPDDPSANIQWVKGDVLDVESLRQAMSGCEALIHSAGLVSTWRRDRQDFYRVNVQGTENVLQAALQAGVSRVVYTSSFFALGPTDEQPADETWRSQTIPSPTPYAASKAQAIERVPHYQQQGLDVIPLFPALVYGPGKATEGNHIGQMVQDYIRKKLPGIPGEGNKRLTFAYVDDVAQGHILALEKGRTNEPYILGGQDATLIELLSILEDITGIRRPRVELPLILLKGVGLFDVWRARLSRHYQPKLTPDVVEVYKHHWRYSSQKAMRELGYTRTPLKAGLVRILEDLGFLKDERSTIL